MKCKLNVTGVKTESTFMLWKITEERKERQSNYFNKEC